MADPQLPMPPHGLLGLEPAPLWIRYEWALWVLGVLLIGVAVGLVLALRLRRRPPSPVTESPWYRLEQEFEYWALGDRERPLGETCTGLSLLLRRACELHSRSPLGSQTLTELRGSLRQRSRLPVSTQDEMLEFLSLADEVKFAGRSLSSDELGVWVQRIRGWLATLKGNGV